MAFTVILVGGPPWGFRIAGGRDFEEPITIAKINPNSKAYNEGIDVGDRVLNINGDRTERLDHNDALKLIRNANQQLSLELSRDQKRIPEIRINGPTSPTRSLDLSQNGPLPHINGSSSEKKAYKPVSFNVSSSKAVTSPVSSAGFSDTPGSVRPQEGHPVKVYGPHEGHPVKVYVMDTAKEEPIQPEEPPKPVNVKTSATLKLSEKSKPAEPLRKITSPPPGVLSPRRVGVEHQPARERDFDAIFRGTAPWKQDDKRPSSPTKSSVLSPTAESPYKQVSPQSARSDFGWRPSEANTASAMATITTTTTTTATSSPSVTSPSYSSWNGTISSFAETKSGLPQTQSATVTLLQKNRERRRTRELEGNYQLSQTLPRQNGNYMSPGPLAADSLTPKLPPNIKTIMVDENEIPQGAIYMGQKEVIEGDKKHTDSFYLLPGDKDKGGEKKIAKVETKSRQYEGIGPTDAQTGIPIVPRGSVAEDHHHDWYKQMYSSLHRSKKPEEKNTYKPTYVFPDEAETETEKEEPNPYKPSYEFLTSNQRLTRDKNETFDGYGSLRREKHSSWSPPHARYREEKYKVQPNSIEDYEPGRSSLALRESRVEDSTDESHQHNPPVDRPGQHSQYTDNKRSPGIRKKERPLSPGSDIPNHELYKQIQRGADIPFEGLQFPRPQPSPKKDHTLAASNAPSYRRSLPDARSPNSTLDRRRRDEEAARRRQEMERITTLERRKRMEEEIQTNAQRRHHDFWMPSEKSAIPVNQYSEDEGPDSSSLLRPNKRPTQIRGKAKAIYSFTAQNPKELPFRKGDSIYLRRQVDRNWYEGERNGRVGIFPRNYIEIITSLDEARASASEREGSAMVKYSFKAHTTVELSLRKGEMVTLIRRVDDNWYEGRVGSRQGIFPVSYVVVDLEPDTPMGTPCSSYAPTPVPGSPGQLSPTSSIFSNGPAPTIPSAPISPTSSRGGNDPLDSFNFDFNNLNINDLNLNMQKLTQNMQSLTNGLSGQGRSPENRYRSEYTPVGHAQGQPDRPSSAGPYQNAPYSNGGDPYGTAQQRCRSSLGMYEYNEPTHHTSRYESRIKSPTPLDNALSLKDRPASPRGTNKVSTPSRTHTDSVSTGMLGKKSYPLYRAVFAYYPQNGDELELKEGDIVYVMEKCDDGWFVGTSERTKDFGTFPGNYVKPV